LAGAACMLVLAPVPQALQPLPQAPDPQAPHGAPQDGAPQLGPQGAAQDDMGAQQLL
jgi:hypothetical protein